MRGAIAKTGRCCHFHPPASSPQPPESNRESLRLEIHLTHRKQTPDPHSNRERNAYFQFAINSPEQHPQNTLPTLKKPATNPESNTSHPSFLLRLKPTPTVYFPQLTRDFNRTLLRLNASTQRIRIETRNQKTRKRSTRSETNRHPESRPNPHKTHGFQAPPRNFFRIAFSPLNEYPHPDLESRRRPACK